MARTGFPGLGDSADDPFGYRPDMAELTLLLVFALFAGVMGLIFQLFDR